MFKRIFVKVFLFFLSVGVHAQYSRYWIQFKDKNNNPYSVSNPSAFLSARAIQRRTAQSIPIVQNDIPLTPAYVDSIRNVPNVTILNRSKWFNALTIFTTDTNALDSIMKFSFVATYQPVQRVKGKKSFREKTFPVNPVNILPSQPTALTSSFNYGPSFHQINMLNGVCLHNMGFDGSGIHIAVFDAGFWKVDSLPVFDSLRANNQILGTWDFVDNDSMVYDSHTHGTMVLSLMGGNLPGQIVGTAPKAKYWLLRTEQGASEYIIEEDNWVSAAEFADSAGVDVFNTSLGYSEFDDPTQNHTYADMDGNTTRITIATDIAASKGILPVNSAGNAAWSPWFYIIAPADADSVLAVGAVDSLKNCAGFSSRGPSSDGRVKPNVAAMGQDVYVAMPSGGIGKGSGTSFSSPLIAGLAACLWQANPGSTNMQLFNAIQQSASQFANPDSLLGYGIPDFCFADILLSQREHVTSDTKNIDVYPNPSPGKFTVLSKHVVTNIKAYNVFGRMIHSSSESTIELSAQPSGVYLLMVETDAGTFSGKVIRK